MKQRGMRVTALAVATVMAGSLFVGGVAADPGGLPTIVGDGLVEVNVPSRDAIDALNDGEWDLAEYVRPEFDGSYTIRVVVDQDELGQLAAMGFGIGDVIEDEDDWRAAQAAADATIAKNATAASLAEAGGAGQIAAFGILPPLEVTIQRAVTYENYAGRYLYVEAVTTEGLPGNAGPTMAMAWDNGDGATFSEAIPMGKFTDTDPTPDVYLYHRDLVRISGPGVSTPAFPTTIRVASSVGGVAEAPVTPWLSGGLPPIAGGYLTGFFDHYMDTYELHADITALAAAYPDLAEVIDLPYETYGYQRPAMAIMNGTASTGNAPANNNQGGSTAVNQARTVVLWSRAMGHLGGNDLTVAFTNPGVPDSPLGVSLDDHDITVSLATDAGGATTSTAAEVVEALNTSVTSALLEATVWTTNAGAGVVLPRARVNLSDFLAAPPSVPRGPIVNKMIRIGKTAASGTGVFLYCNQHAREWATPVTCIETAHRLLENYGIDPATKEFVDDLNIFIIPTQNPGGNIYSRYDFSSQRKTLYNYCREFTPTATAAMPSGRNGWGVDMNRNSTQYSGADGYGGASTSCSSETYRGPFEASEPEIQNELWVNNNPDFRIKFANNIHTSGGYFMWSPGSYINAGRITAPAPNIGVEAYFFETADTVLGRIAESRGTVIPPERTGPIADVLYSAAGNSADEQWYSNQIISYSFEAGADRHNQTSRSTLALDAAAGATGIRMTSTSGLAAGDSIMIEPGASEDPAVIVALNTAAVAPDPNVLLATPLANAHLAGAPVTEVTFSGVGFFPNFDTEGSFEALEFASGNYGLLEGALAYQRDATPPTVDLMVCDSLSPTIDCDPATTNQAKQSGTFITTFGFGNEPSVIRYTTDGSTPTMASPTWEAQGPRRPGEFFEFDETTTLKFFGTDIKGNVGAVQTIKLSIDPNAPTIDIVEPQDAGGVGGEGNPGNYALDSEQFASYSCDDDDSGVISCVGTVADGAAFDTSSVGFHDFTVDAEDLAGNTASVTHTYNVFFPGNGGLQPPFAGTEGSLISLGAGSALPLKFSLGGVDYGLGIIADGYPRTAQIDCATFEVIGDWSFIGASGASGFRKTDGSYHYNAKTSTAWAGTCRVLQLKLIDNSVYELLLSF